MVVKYSLEHGNNNYRFFCTYVSGGMPVLLMQYGCDWLFAVENLAMLTGQPQPSSRERQMELSRGSSGERQTELISPGPGSSVPYCMPQYK
jgi:hypothetical protein